MNKKVKMKYQLLSSKLKELKDYKVNTDAPPYPIVTVTQSKCELIGNSVAARNFFILPWLLGLLFTLGYHVNDFVVGWKAREASTIAFIERRKRIDGDDYFERTKHTGDLRRYARINEEGKHPLKSYVVERYFHSGEIGTRVLKLDIFMLIFYGISIPGLLIWAIRFRRKAPVIFDRERQLVYSWHRGEARVVRYEDLHIYENYQFLNLVLRAAQSDGTLGWSMFMFQPTGNPLYNGKESYKPLLAYIGQFMEYGKDKVLPDQDEYYRRQPFFFYEDKKPEDLEEQMERVLSLLDAEDIDAIVEHEGSESFEMYSILKNNKAIEEG